MKLLHLICDRCHTQEIEDDADDWYETKDGRDLCRDCTPPRWRKPLRDACGLPYPCSRC